MSQQQEKVVRVQDMYRVIESDFVPEFHPFRYYLEHLPPWDGHSDYILEMSVSVNVREVGRAMTDLGFRRMRSHGERGYVVVAYSADEVKARKRIKACDAKPDEAVPLTHLTQLTQYSENPSRTCARMYAQHFSENNPSNVSI